jgi:peptide-methionine (S)-S-oxide reductase
MSAFHFRNFCLLLAFASLTSCTAGDRANNPFPNPAVDAHLTQTGMSQEAVLAGGCFWGVQAVFQHVKGVKSAISGYAGGTRDKPTYELVSTGETGHAESVKILYDPSQVTFGQLLRVFFSVAHDPTQLNRQGPDVGSQYRSVVFYSTPEQKQIAEDYIAQLAKAQTFPLPIATQLVPLKAFYPAEAYHQNYAAHHPNDPYIAYNDAPKIVHLRQQLPDLYREK